MEKYERVCATIDLDAVATNLNNLHKKTAESTKVIAVIKADGYGHGALPIARWGEHQEFIWGVAVATVEEARELREQGIEKPILLLGFTFSEHYPEIVAKQLHPTVFKLSMAQELSKAAVAAGQKVNVHLAVDTGMGRIGFADTSDSMADIVAIAQLPGIVIKGIFTHFARADETDKSAAIKQLTRFEDFINGLAAQGVTAELHHCSNSAAITDLPQANMDLVRAGISMYGLYPSEEMGAQVMKLQPAMTLTSHITYLKTVAAGTAIGYGGTYVAPQQIRVATIPVGYADGYPRNLSNKGYVLIRGKKAPVIGRVCMDQFMVDVTEIADVQELDEVTLVGTNGDVHISVEQLSDLSGRFNYEFVCAINKRVPRIYIKDGKSF